MTHALLIANDIGGFRPAFAFLSEKYSGVKCLVDGPALSEASICSADVIDTLSEVKTADYDVFVCTGWATLFEKKWMQYFHRNSINWTAALDNWNDYANRFYYQRKYYFPNQIIVFDQYAYELCKTIFPNIKCNQVSNIFDENFISDYKKFGSPCEEENKFDLFLADPISSHYSGELGYDEFDQIQYILKKLNGKYCDAHQLRIRPHPSEDNKKYETYIKENNLKHVEVSNDGLVADIYLADFVFGDSSYAMHLAMMVGKKVFCSIPLHSVNTKLPHNAIKYLRELDV